MSSRIFLEQSVGTAVVLALLYWWTGLPEGSVGELALSSLLLVASVGAFFWLALRAVRSMSASEAPGAMGIAIRAVGFALALVFAYWIVWWVPAFDSLAAQAASMVTRFTLGYLAAVAGWLGLLRAIPAGRPRSSQVSTAGRP